MAKNNKICNCFMTGKGCTHERSISDVMKDKEKRAFVIMSFAPELTAIYEWQLQPYFQEKGYVVDRADEGAQRGYIMCEKVCRQIQQADLVVVDISFSNPNVFYEFGLAVALQKDILLINLGDNKENSGIQQALTGLIGLKEPKARTMHHPNFGLMGEEIDSYILRYDRDFEDYALFLGSELGNKGFVVLSPLNERELDRGKKNDVYPVVDDYSYITGQMLASAVGKASLEIKKKKPKVDTFFMRPEAVLNGNMLEEHKKKPEYEKNVVNTGCLRELCTAIQRSLCVMIDITSNFIGNYYWLGYLHGIGRTVVPMFNRGEPKQPEDEGGCLRLDSAPFDIQALWRIEYDTKNPQQLLGNLKDIIRAVYDKSQGNIWRNKFWKNILDDNEVALFVGSQLLGVGRYSIGDWDYRTAAEIIRFLTTAKENINIQLENPQPKITEKLLAGREIEFSDYAKMLEEKMKDRNCIIIASPDVNDYTEVALSGIYGVYPYRSLEEESDFCGFISYKLGVDESDTMDHAFYRKKREEASAPEKPDQRKRGFLYQMGVGRELEIMHEHINPGDRQGKFSEAADSKTNLMLGQLVAAKNPFGEDKNKTIIIVSGVSGPATFGIAQMITGRMYDQFNDIAEYQEKINANEALRTKFGYNRRVTETDVPSLYSAQSEDILEKIVRKRINSERPEITDVPEAGSLDGCCAIVDVSYSNDADPASPSSDDRKVVDWNLCSLRNRGPFNPNLLHNPMTIVRSAQRGDDEKMLDTV